ncbi:MAG: hypothetical protein LBD98_00230 [Endomicrobium sp.]|jgi:hypothetical protein|nr:hypothetical protein [Endomicrobium sp.]
MKKFFVIWMIFCCLFITNAFGAGEFSLWSGLSLIRLKSVGGVGSYGTFLVPESQTPQLSLLGVGYMQGISDDWKIGVKLGLAGSKFYLSREAYTSKQGEDIPKKEGEFFSGFYAVMIGGSYNKSVSKKINLNGKLFFGYSRVKFISKNSGIKSLPFIPTKQTTCFIAELSTGIQYLFTKRFGIGFDVGYRFTPKIEVSEAIKLNFSGVTGALNLSYKV